MHGHGGHDLLVQVVHVVGHDEVRGVGARGAHPAGVDVERRGQAVDPGVVDDLEAAEQLDLLPAVQALPQRRRHLAQRLPGYGGK